MEFRPLEPEGLLEIIPQRIADARGYFSETFRLDKMKRRIGDVAFVQANQSMSVRAGTVRGIHFQIPPAAQGKLVHCEAGSVFDVAVDLRQGSPTYGRWTALTLSASTGNRLWIPPGFGHGFCTLESNSVISYEVTDYYSASHDRGLAWNDPDLAIGWPDIADPDTLSSKDQQQPLLADLPPYFAFKDPQ